LTQGDILALQHLVGNQAVMRLIDHTSAASPVRLTTPVIPNQVIQPVRIRIPEYSEEFVRVNRDLVREMLINAVEKIPDKDFKEVNFRGLVTFETKESLVKWLGNKGIPPQNILLMREAILSSENEVANFGDRASVPQKMEQPKEDSGVILGQLGRIIGIIEHQIFGKFELHKLVFGPDCNPSEINEVFRLIWAKLWKIYSEKKDLVTLNSDPEHLDVAKVGALTSRGADTAGISQGQYQALLEGTDKGLGTIVHEFSHSVAGTQDKAYSTDALSKLTTKLREKNAETYAQEFLYILDGDKTRLYNPALIVNTKEAKAESGAESRKQRLKAIDQQLVMMWNEMDNVFNVYHTAYQMTHGTLVPTEHGAEELMDLAKHLAAVGMIPYRLNLNKDANVILALIEQRTSILHGLRNSKTLRDALQSKGIHKEQIEAEITEQEISSKYRDMTLLAVSAALKLSVQDAGILFDELSRLSKRSKQKV
jgi:hypothetical protein